MSPVDYHNVASVSEYCSDLLSRYDYLLQLNVYSSKKSPKESYPSQYKNQTRSSFSSSTSSSGTESNTKSKQSTPTPLIINHLTILREKVKEWINLTEHLKSRSQQDPYTLQIASHDYLMYCGYIILCDHWVKMEDHSFRSIEILNTEKDQMDSEDYKDQKEFYESKIQVNFLYFRLI